MNQLLTDLIWHLDLSPNIKLVLLALARTADLDGRCDPRRADASLLQTGIGVNQISMYIHRLLGMGRLAVTPRESDCPLQYVIVMDDLADGGAAS